MEKHFLYAVLKQFHPEKILKILWNTFKVYFILSNLILCYTAKKTVRDFQHFTNNRQHEAHRVINKSVLTISNIHQIPALVELCWSLAGEYQNTTDTYFTYLNIQCLGLETLLQTANKLTVYFNHLFTFSLYHNSSYFLNAFCFHRNIYQYLTFLWTITSCPLAILKTIWLNRDSSHVLLNKPQLKELRVYFKRTKNLPVKGWVF